MSCVYSSIIAVFDSQKSCKVVSDALKLANTGDLEAAVNKMDGQLEEIFLSEYCDTDEWWFDCKCKYGRTVLIVETESILYDDHEAFYEAFFACGAVKILGYVENSAVGEAETHAYIKGEEVGYAKGLDLIREEDSKLFEFLSSEIEKRGWNIEEGANDNLVEEVQSTPTQEKVDYWFKALFENEVQCQMVFDGFEKAKKEGIAAGNSYFLAKVKGRLFPVEKGVDPDFFCRSEKKDNILYINCSFSKVQKDTSTSFFSGISRMGAVVIVVEIDTSVRDSGYGYLNGEKVTKTEALDAAVKDDVDAMLRRAVATNRKDLVQEKLNEGASPDLLIDDDPILIFAIKKGRNEIASMLIDVGANLEAHDSIFGRTPLQMACYKKNADLVDKLLESGADINARSNTKETPLHIAVGSREIDLIKKLIDVGANVNSKDKKLQTPLHECYDSKSILFLLNNGADINSVDKDGCVPVFWYLKIKNEPSSLVVLKKMVRLGLDLTICDNKGRNIGWYAQDNPRCLKYLSDNGVKIIGD